MSYLLINEPPLQVIPSLAVKIGLNEAIILQQIHYWLIDSKHEYAGERWVYNTYANWQKQFPFLSYDTIKRAIKNLEKKGLIIVGNFNKLKMDRTKWYRIDYKALGKLESSIGQAAPNNRANCPDQEGSLPPAIPETTTETTTEREEPPGKTGDSPPTEIPEKKNSEIKEVLNFFADVHLQEVIDPQTGAHIPAHIDWGKDGTLCKKLLGTYSAEFIRKLINKFFRLYNGAEEGTEFISTRGTTWGIFYSQAGMLATGRQGESLADQAMRLRKQEGKQK